MPQKAKDSNSGETKASEEKAAPVVATPSKPKVAARQPKSRKTASAKSQKRYDPKIKLKIINAAKGKPLTAAHEAAKKVGYKGSALSLYQMLRNAGAKRRKKAGRPKGSKNKATNIKSGIKSVPSRKIGSTLIGGLSEVEAIVRREVQTRLISAKQKAVAAFELALGI